MGNHKDKLFDDWWPVFQSLVLAKAPARDVAQALASQRGAGSRASRPSWLPFLRQGARGLPRPGTFAAIRVKSLAELFCSIERYSGGNEYVLPTRSPWSVVWEDFSNCVTDHSVGWRLARRHGFETIHFYSTDRNSTQLAGTMFTYFWPADNDREDPQRNVYCCNQGSRWHFHASGQPLPQEDLARYEQRRKRERLNEQALEVAVGFALHEDSADANDAAWFALAVECTTCHWTANVYTDEVK
jgi:hypothetical protein